MPRPTRHDYDGPGSFARLHEAAISVADADDLDQGQYDAACQRMRLAAAWYVVKHPNLLGRLIGARVVVRVVTARRRPVQPMLPGANGW